MKICKIVMLPLICTFFEMLSADALAQLPKVMPRPPLQCPDKLPDVEKRLPSDIKARREIFLFSRFVNDRIPSQPTAFLGFQYPSLVGEGEMLKNPKLTDWTTQVNVKLNVYRITDWDRLPKHKDADWLKVYDLRSYWAGTRKFPPSRHDELNKISRPYEVDAGLIRYDTTRYDIVFFHPSRQDSGPYGLPKFNCRGFPAEIGQALQECEGRMRIDPDMVVMYSFGSQALSCWASIEESIKQVIRITKANE